MKGMILPAGSPLAQFNIERYADGGTDEHLPCPVWVDARKPLRPGVGGIACGCSGPFYAIRKFPEGREATTIEGGYTPSVCLCMGSFIE